MLGWDYLQKKRRNEKAWKIITFIIFVGGGFLYSLSFQ